MMLEADRSDVPMAATASRPGESGQSYLELADVTKLFGDFAALRDISLEVNEGEFVCFLGPSGCGKTTLLRCIAGLETQSGGRIFQGGRDISNLPVPERDFGIVFQSYALFPNLTVSGNVGYGLRSRGRRRDEVNHRVAELLQLVGLPGTQARFPAQLSGGQQQRVALARALATEPGLLLLDEPLSALDARVRQHLRREVKQLQGRLGVTTIMVTHDQEEALTMADRIVVMNQGIIEQIGTPRDVYRNPRTAFVADFVGTMNFLPATIDGVAGIRLGSHRLSHASPINGLADGTEVLACLRPEEVVVRGIDADSHNRIDMHIEDLEFIGHFLRARLSADDLDGATLTVDLSINDVRDLNLDTNMSLPVVLPPDQIRVFPRE